MVKLAGCALRAICAALIFSFCFYFKSGGSIFGAKDYYSNKNGTNKTEKEITGSKKRLQAP